MVARIDPVSASIGPAWRLLDWFRSIKGNDSNWTHDHRGSCIQQMPRKIAFVWFEEKRYFRLLEVVFDRHRFADTFEDWRNIAEHQFKVLRSHSLNVVKVVVDPEELAEWCIAKGRAVDADSRSQFAALKLVDEDHDVQTAH